MRKAVVGNMRVTMTGDGGSVDWFTGLPTGVWYLIGVAIFCVGIWCLVMALGAMSAESDLRVRGWENRPKSTEDEGEWWAREYPLGSEEVDEWDWSNGCG